MECFHDQSLSDLKLFLNEKTCPTVIGQVINLERERKFSADSGSVKDLRDLCTKIMEEDVKV